MAQDSLTIKAQELWDKGDNEGSYLILERAIFFLHDSLKLPYVVKKAELLLKEKDFETSGHYWKIAWEICEDSITSINYQALVCYCYIKIGEYNIAKSILAQMPDYSKELERKRSLYLSILLLNEGFIDSCNKTFTQSITSNNTLQTCFRKTKKVVYKKCSKAMLFSFIAPGLGQLYSGDNTNAVKSFTLNVVMASLFYSTFINYSLADASLLMGPWVFRYYTGGAKQAKHNCITRKEDAIERLETLLILQYLNIDKAKMQ
ncbi:MAG: hypothetical protein WC150_00325 [Bacteroidia bacterium]